MSDRGFVDVHSHVVPSGDDGAASLEEGLELCRLAYETGTRVLFATPHAHAPWDTYPRTPERERIYDAAFPAMRSAVADFGLDLRRGWEVYPTELTERDPGELRLEGTAAVLVEFPGWWVDAPDALAVMHAACSRVESAGLVPVLAHPERCRAIAEDPAAAQEFAGRGWMLCLNAGSLVGDHGPTPEQVGWRLLEDGVVALAASDGHRRDRPPTLDRAYAAVEGRCGADRARPLFDGSRLPWLH